MTLVSLAVLPITANAFTRWQHDVSTAECTNCEKLWFLYEFYYFTERTA